MAELAPAEAAGNYRLGYAGDTFNTAWYLAQLAPEIALSYFTALGDDPISQEMRHFIEAAGIDTQHVITIADRTVGLYLISLENGERSFSYWRGQSAARCLADDPARLAQAMAASDLVYFSGITLAILPPAARMSLLQALRTARAAGKRIVFDPNLRPRLWASSDEMTKTILQAAEVSDIALPSFEDDATWFADSTPLDTAERYRSSGVPTVIVKNGAAPVLYLDKDAQGTVPVLPVADLVDTTAAGDSFNAGVLAGLAKGEDLTGSITRGVALAHRVVQHRGALVRVSEMTRPAAAPASNAPGR